jgi:hypothetical protein
MIEVLKETTPELHPHVYYVNKKSGKLVAFQPVDGQVKIFDVPKSFGKRYRKFEKIGEVETV